MTVLLLRLAGPMQAWGVRSRFTERRTELAPSKSGVIGMLAAAVGRRRTDPVEDLLTLRFGVRKDQPGTVIRDFHTARTLDGKDSMPLSTRYYLADAVFLTGIEGDRELLSGLDEALRHPVFPLYLGRRSCPPTHPVSLGLRETDLLDALSSEPWQASEWFRKRHRSALPFAAELLVDQESVSVEERGDFYGVRDVPVSYDPRRRDYGFRNVERRLVPVGPTQEDPHDPMAAVEEAKPCS
ncbi:MULTISPECIES: type I-E CRISPR-associated protein Cas5/CasD [unclassified Actinomyces]|uniref:type I-E CRISPR-associated protein Cas5/CasD n=1 Tax=unclassified Actinomyces TaxID=2609248 RepID=UPI00201768F2|nr:MULTISPECIES: type I-E CRISPR-associated protein Cas5/CasD [unclassified Actinomyces]MCL3778431.1 type I-E CRISPR-associated protein Cas5/CasD [Actinomyces sp. AC-20-1]MCL3790008.1 type I-E CRISPR-associated protein Cas5/CasD [Actinomyces sp. 187325]MCL3792552.1 type I-E CRISPR-associated protein Cas5/CasD [Actinomyces sp. 186855]MCL3794585.1 type I-E CRISPR-associated protein Cas5/CasD [Actinomyces sp. 217892]